MESCPLGYVDHYKGERASKGASEAARRTSKESGTALYFCVIFLVMNESVNSHYELFIHTISQIQCMVNTTDHESYTPRGTKLTTSVLAPQSY